MTLTVAAPVQAVRCLSMIALEAVPPEDRDVAVNGPLWDSHVIPTIEETTTEIADRRRMLKQASRRIKRSVDLIQDLRDQLESKLCTEREESSRSTSWRSGSENSKPPPFDTRKRSYELKRPCPDGDGGHVPTDSSAGRGQGVTTTGDGLAPQTAGSKHHFSTRGPVETPVLWRSRRSFFSNTSSNRQHPIVSTNCNPNEWSGHLTPSRPSQLHVHR